MARTRLFSALGRLSRLTQAARREGVPVAEFAAMERERFNQSRREFLRKTTLGVGAVAISAKALFTSGCRGGTARRRDASIAIVGAGMAGLMCARTLEKAGHRATLYDAQNRVGGRMWTQRELPGGQLLELGGELIDTEHTVLRTLATELDLTLDDLAAYDREVQAEVISIGGRLIPESEILASWAKVHGQIASDLAASETNEAELVRLDKIPLHTYISSLPDIDPTLRDILDLAYVCEYGLPTQEQSAMNLIWLIGTDSPDTFEIFGTSDERFHCHQGNDAIPTRVAAALAGAIETGHRLVRVTTLSDGRHQLSFDLGGTTIEATYEHVVLAIPWTLLRDVEFAPALPADKANMIQNLGYGTNAKLMLGFDSRPWRTAHNKSGSTITDTGPQTIWETSRGQAGPQGILTAFTGGAEGLAIGQSSAEARAQSYLPKIDALYPGTQAAYRPGSAVRMHWPTFEYAKGSYACFKPGQAIWSGTEGKRVGNLHFAGEHTSAELQGFMEGAARSGLRVAEEILSDLS